MSKGIVYDVAWQAIDEAILRGLRAARRPVTEDRVAAVCSVSHLCTRFQLRDSLGRLADRGLVRRIEAERLHPEWPLLGTICEVAYEATGGDHVQA